VAAGPEHPTVRSGNRLAGVVLGPVPRLCRCWTDPLTNIGAQVAVQAPSEPLVVHAPDEVRILVPRQPGPRARLRELWTTRRLLGWFARQFVGRLYVRTWLGWWWIPLRPLINVVPRTVIFGGLLKAPSNGAPYLLFFLVGMSAWEALYRTLYYSTLSQMMTRGLLKRMYLPRLTILVSTAGVGVVEYLLYTAFAVLATGAYTLIDHHFPLNLGVHTLLVPAALVMILCIGLVLGLWTSVPGATGMRDVRWTVKAILSVWFLLTPVIYPLSAVPAKFQTIAQLNPMTAPMEMMRKAMFGVGDVTVEGLAVTIGTIVIVGTFGLLFFSRSEAAALDGT
jgi:lipopolysaccharide transport system permease protein